MIIGVPKEIKDDEYQENITYQAVSEAFDLPYTNCQLVISQTGVVKL
ncbi:hypothetical protein QUF63_09950 [Anaerolineales bacterium HSG25]|nr:hypothetical protein [Anaerolineales bacterium HSG25]